MIYHTVLVGFDGFSKEDDLIMKDDKLPASLFVSRKTGTIGYYKADPFFSKEGDPRRFYLITSFYGMGKHVAVYKEIL